MTEKEAARALERMIREDGKRPPEEQLRDLYEAGIIDLKGRVFSQSLRTVENLLKRKKFTGISAFHVGRVPGGAVRLHEKVRNPREAVGPYAAMRKIIRAALDEEGLWKALDAAGFRQQPAKPRRKKTG